MRIYSAARPRDASQASMSLTRHRVAFGPIFRGVGKLPVALQRQTVATLTPSIFAAWPTERKFVFVIMMLSPLVVGQNIMAE